MLKMNNWSSHQSYKDRKPPWIRLHKTMLDDYEFHMMSVSARALLPMLWLLASEDDDPTSGLIKDNYKKIAFRLRCTEKEIVQAIKECAENGFLQVIEKQACIQTVTDPYMDSTVSVPSETETETEVYSKETDKKELAFEKNFSQFWEWFPVVNRTKGSMKKAKASLRQALKKDDFNQIIQGLDSYAKYIKHSGQSNADAFRWINDERWGDDWTVRLKPLPDTQCNEYNEAAVRGMLRAENPDF